MLTIANKGRYVVKKYPKPVYVIYESSLMFANSFFLRIMSKEKLFDM